MEVMWCKINILVLWPLRQQLLCCSVTKRRSLVLFVQLYSSLCWPGAQGGCVDLGLYSEPVSFISSPCCNDLWVGWASELKLASLCLCLLRSIVKRPRGERHVDQSAASAFTTTLSTRKYIHEKVIQSRWCFSSCRYLNAFVSVRSWDGLLMYLGV